MELPPAALLFRSARQYVYGVLFSLAETQRKMERLAIRRRLPIEGKFWFYCWLEFWLSKNICKHIMLLALEQSLRKYIIHKNTYRCGKCINLSPNSLIIKHSGWSLLIRTMLGFGNIEVYLMQTLLLSEVFALESDHVSGWSHWDVLSCRVIWSN